MFIASRNFRKNIASRKWRRQFRDAKVFQVFTGLMNTSSRGGVSETGSLISDLCVYEFDIMSLARKRGIN